MGCNEGGSGRIEESREALRQCSTWGSEDVRRELNDSHQYSNILYCSHHHFYKSRVRTAQQISAFMCSTAASDGVEGEEGSLRKVRNIVQEAL